MAQIEEEEAIDLQITVTIGSYKYLIRVPKNANLPSLVQQFLASNRLSPKYQQTILSLVQAQLEATVKSFQNSPLKEAKRVREEVQMKKYHGAKVEGEKTKYSTNASTDNYLVRSPVSKKREHPFNKTSKNVILSKIQRQIEQKEQANEAQSHEDPQAKRVYEKWKQKQKSRVLTHKQIIPNKNDKSFERSRKKPTAHSPDYFYKKGKQFKDRKEEQNEKKFKEYYSFQPNSTTHSFHKESDISVGEVECEKMRLHERLFKEKKLKEAQALNSQLYKLEKYASNGPVTPRSKDEVKERVRRKDEEVDRALFQMIKEGSIKNRSQLRATSRSPFRKTFFQ